MLNAKFNSTRAAATTHLRSLGLKKKWSEDKSTYWMEMKLYGTIIKEIEIAVDVDVEEPSLVIITVFAKEPTLKDEIWNIIAQEPYTRDRLIEVIAFFKI